MERPFGSCLLPIALLAAVASAQSRPANRISAILEQMREREATFATLSLTLEMNVHFVAKLEPLRCESSLRMQGKDRQATSVVWRTEVGEMRIECVRNERGVFLHEQAPYKPEKFFQAKPEPLRRLAESGGTAPGDSSPYTGSKMVENLAADYRLEFVGEEVLEDVPCLLLRGPAAPASRAAPAPGLPPASRAAPAPGPGGGDEVFSLRPDSVEVWIGRDDLVVRRVSEKKGAEVLRSVRVTGVHVNEPIPASAFELAVPPGAKLVDIMEDPEKRRQIEAMLPGSGKPDGGRGESRPKTRPHPGR